MADGINASSSLPERSSQSARASRQQTLWSSFNDDDEYYALDVFNRPTRGIDQGLSVDGVPVERRGSTYFVKRKN